MAAHSTFTEFFTAATRPPAQVSGFSPYDYQRRLAGGDDGAECRSQLIEVPTGLWKTAGVVLAWLWNRVIQPDAGARGKWPRRLVYCLPMRTLVEQTEREVRTWLLRLARKCTKPRDGSALRWLALRSPSLLMGGEERTDWDVHPEKEAILIGTQDMLLSRALNRGYGMSRYRWPMHFALLNNDALWVMDETQLMGVGVETSAQLDGFRAATVHCPTWWMSATLDTAQLDTVDHREQAEDWPRVCLSPEEKEAPAIREQFAAVKPISEAPFKLSPETKASYAKTLAALIAEKHAEGTFTLVVLNRVSRAREVYEQLLKLKKDIDPNRVALIHSRFRPADRVRHERLLFGEGDRIVIATQAIEAGVDVSAQLLITEMAPWSSLVQRFGRCNRQGRQDDAAIMWIDIAPKDEKDDLALPYNFDHFATARAAITPLADAGPQSLETVSVPVEPVIRPVLRRKDLRDLFDTTPDLCGQDLDISRYIRDGTDSDVQFFWRKIAEDAPTPGEAPPARDELCRVSIADAGKSLKSDKVHAWHWNPLDEVWEKAKRPRPGGVYLVDAASGGYDDALGWTGDLKDKPAPSIAADQESPGYGKDPATFQRHRQTLADHTREVVAAIESLASDLALDPCLAAALRTAAVWHDAGKAHPVFQTMLGGDGGELLAKSDRAGGTPKRDGEHVKGFRHELASALAWLIAGPPDAPERDFIAYLIATPSWQSAPLHPLPAR